MSVVWHDDISPPPNSLLAELDAGGVQGQYVGPKEIDYKGESMGFYASLRQNKKVKVQVLELNNDTCELHFKKEYEVECIGIVGKQSRGGGDWKDCRQIFYLYESDYIYEALMVSKNVTCTENKTKKAKFKQLILRKHIANCDNSERVYGWPRRLEFNQA